MARGKSPGKYPYTDLKVLTAVPVSFISVIKLFSLACLIKLLPAAIPAIKNPTIIITIDKLSIIIIFLRCFI